MTTLHDYFATCARGLEPILAEELRGIGAQQIVAGRGGVSFQGDLELLYKANLWLRTAIRVLKPILRSHVASTDELYEAVRTIDWSQYLTPKHTLAVDSNVRDSAITHSQYAARRVKDAICDQFVDKLGIRPSVDPERPMLGINLHISRDEAILSLDSSWDSLHKRGYRPALTVAPLNEALAAGLILTTGWDGTVPFIDPMCGSGGIAIEAAWIALKRPPGLTRKHFGFMGWMDFEVGQWSDLREDARRNMLKALPAPIEGFDVRNDVVDFARHNARSAGIGHLVTFEKQDIRTLALPDPKGFILCNPPYGERLGEEAEVRSLYRDMSATFREGCPGWKCHVFTSENAPWREFGKPERRWPFWNGKIGCALFLLKGPK